MKIGKYNISEIIEGTIGLDGGAMFGVVPKELWNKTNPSDEKNRVTLAMRLLLLESDRKKILIDTGVGENWNDKFSSIYRVEHNVYSIETALSQKGLCSADITDVILTHLHFDHTGGALKKDGDRFVPAYPNATYHVQSKHLVWALGPSDKDKASFVEERFMPLIESGLMHQMNGPTQFDDEIELVLDHGHTFFQQLVKISDGNNTLFHAGDLMPFSSHIHLPYVMAYDLMPLETMNHKKEVLKKAVEENWLVFFQHDPYTATTTITMNEKGFIAKEKFEVLP